MKRLLLGSAAAAVTAAALLLGGVFSSGGSAAPQTAPQLDRLGNRFAQRARETGDASYYARAEAAYHRALRLAPDDLAATIGLGSVALSRHEFRRGLVLGRRAVALSPSTAAGYGVVGDALVELGRYEDGFATFDKMVSLKPSVSSYARISYARELLGDVPGAARAMRLAVDSAVGEPEALAWSLTQLGKLYWSNGRLGEAAREYRAALEVHPRYPAALNALAVVEAARGRRPRAIALARTAAEILPLPQYVATLGDLLHDKAARRQYALVGAIARLERAHGVNLDLEIALFDVDHRIDLQRTVELARLAQRERPSIDGDDVLAWALARTGGCREALKYSRLALRLGTRDAPKFFHRGVIERCLGHHREARAWFARAHRTNPYWRQP
ncbi:MAG TPA: tetratricopeptide repeat protein [Gaiellaceae bacterium]|nr:tetratricopeptide repeat protein [Gaiellaceae bacterium]